MENNSHLYLLVGTYASVEEESIYLYDFDQQKGTFTPVSSMKGVLNPSYLTRSPHKDVIYAVSEEDTKEEAGASTIFFDRENKTLSLINFQHTEGEAPCYINAQENFVVTANYSGGSVSVFPVDEEKKLLPLAKLYQFDGHGIVKDRQDKSHIHCVLFSPDNTFLFVTDLGADCIYRYNTDLRNPPFLKEESLISFPLEPGSGPRHLVFHPNGQFLYLINELSGMVTAFEYNNGDLKPLQYIVADSLAASGSGDIHISPDGRFLYTSHRLEGDGIAIFKIDEITGLLTRISYHSTGIHPRNFIITPNGKYVLIANRDDNNIQLFERDQETGILTNTGKEVTIAKPVCLKFMEK